MAGVSHYELPLPRFDVAPRLLIVVSPYYREIADGLIAGARAVAEQAGAVVDQIDVPGALEIPTAIGMAADGGDYDGYVALGCVIRGETTHYDTVCNDSSRGLMLLGWKVWPSAMASSPSRTRRKPLSARIRRARTRAAARPLRPCI